jgi:ribosomal protein S18 acetylase RimI-like enzyme
MTEISSRPAVLDDREKLEEIFLEELRFHKDLLPDIFEIPKEIITADWLKNIIDDESWAFLVFELDDILAGAVIYKIIESPEDVILRKRRFGYIEEMIVKEEFRGRGIGKRMLEVVSEDLRSKGVTELELDVWEKNENAREFYLKNGFHDVRRKMCKHL